MCVLIVNTHNEFTHEHGLFGALLLDTECDKIDMTCGDSIVSILRIILSFDYTFMLVTTAIDIVCNCNT